MSRETLQTNIVTAVLLIIPTTNAAPVPAVDVAVDLPAAYAASGSPPSRPNAHILADEFRNPAVIVPNGIATNVASRLVSECSSSRGSKQRAQPRAATAHDACREANPRGNAHCREAKLRGERHCRNAERQCLVPN